MNIPITINVELITESILYFFLNIIVTANVTKKENIKGKITTDIIYLSFLINKYFFNKN